jgi:hypothetical protein
MYSAVTRSCAVPPAGLQYHYLAPALGFDARRAYPLRQRGRQEGVEVAV